MGLDMYILKGNKADWEAYQNGNNEAFYDGAEEVAYWRKANAIHGWFVENVQGGIDDCGFYKISEENLITLLDAIKLTIEKYINEGFEEASKVLAPISGFFFGPTHDKEWYREYLIETSDILRNLINNWDDNAVYCYHSSW